MTFNKFCAKHFLPLNLQVSFGQWLGSAKDGILPEGEWKKMWREFYNG